MSRLALKASLNLWRRRHMFRQKRLEAARTAGVQSRVDKWQKLSHAAWLMVVKRRAEIDATRALRDKAADFAMHEVGVMETGGNNRGPRVSQIITYAHGQVGEPWCADFVIWCYGHAGSKIVHAGFPRAVSLMHTPGTIVTSKPRRGDIVRYTFDHTGLFLRWLSDGYFETVEGNTGASGAVSDSATGGDGVYVKKRHVSQVSDFLTVTA